jgi:predicted AlkP superfamily phosphohydrolase/phosphomutase
MLSPRIWTTMMTGQQPDDHGILGFVVENSTRPGGAEFYTSSMRKTSSIWNALTEEGASVGIVSYLVTWPAEDVNGFIVTERAMDPHEKNATWPPGLKGEVREVVDGHIEELRGNDVREGRRDEFSTVVGLELEEKYEPDLFVVYYRQIDGACHTWIDRNYTKVEETYRYIDHTMGQLIAAADEDTTIFIVSDHGCGHGDPSKRGQGINWTLSQHRENGIVIAMGPGIRSSYEMTGNYSAMDMGPTLFYTMGLPIGMDMEGKVIEDMFEPRYLNENPFTFIDTYDTEGPRNTETPVEGISDEAELERLRALGYLN